MSRPSNITLVACISIMSVSSQLNAADWATDASQEASSLHGSPQSSTELTEKLTAAQAKLKGLQIKLAAAQASSQTSEGTMSASAQKATPNIRPLPLPLTKSSPAPEGTQPNPHAEIGRITTSILYAPLGEESLVRRTLEPHDKVEILRRVESQTLVRTYKRGTASDLWINSSWVVSEPTAITQKANANETLETLTQSLTEISNTLREILGELKNPSTTRTSNNLNNNDEIFFPSATSNVISWIDFGWPGGWWPNVWSSSLWVGSPRRPWFHSARPCILDRNTIVRHPVRRNNQAIISFGNVQASVQFPQVPFISQRTIQQQGVALRSQNITIQHNPIGIHSQQISSDQIVPYQNGISISSRGIEIPQNQIPREFQPHGVSPQGGFSPKGVHPEHP